MCACPVIVTVSNDVYLANLARHVQQDLLQVLQLLASETLLQLLSLLHLHLLVLLVLHRLFCYVFTEHSEQC
jgi:hypothetical protein